MNGTELGPCQVIFARRPYDVEVDLLLTGPAMVEGYPLVPGSPFSVALVPPDEPWARRRILRLLRSWADTAAACHAEISFGDELALFTLRCGAESVTASLNDLDVLFASDIPSERSEQ